MGKFETICNRSEQELLKYEEGSDEWVKLNTAYQRLKITDPVRAICYRHGLVNNLALREDILEYIDYLMEDK